MIFRTGGISAKCQFYLLLIITTTILISCSGRNPDVIIIAMPEGPATVSFIKMIDDQPLINGKSVNFVIRQEPALLQSMMVQNQADFVVLPTNMAANLYNKKVDFRVIAIPVWGTLYLLTNTESDELTDLSNDEIHVFGRGTTADILLQEFLSSNNMKNARINYSFSSNQELALALINGKIRHAVVSEPLASQLLPGNSNLRILTAITVGDKNNPDQNDIFAQTSLVVNKKFADKNPETIRQLAITYNESCMFTTQFPDSAAALLYKHGFFTENKLDAAAVLRCNIKYRKASEVANHISQYLEIFRDFDPEVLGGKIPDNEFVYHY